MVTWKSVQDHIGLYEVSDHGEVRSVPRQVRKGFCGTQTVPGRVLRPAKSNKCGHLKVNLSKNGKQRTYWVHLLVARAFLGPCPSGEEVCHGELGASDNNLLNITYGTRSKNQLDRSRDGTSNARPVVCGNGKSYLSMAEASKRTGVDVSSICAVCNGRRTSAGGFTWAHLEEVG